MHERRNSVANALLLRLSCTKLSIFHTNHDTSFKSSIKWSTCQAHIFKSSTKWSTCQAHRTPNDASVETSIEAKASFKHGKKSCVHLLLHWRKFTHDKFKFMQLKSTKYYCQLINSYDQTELELGGNVVCENMELVILFARLRNKYHGWLVTKWAWWCPNDIINMEFINKYRP